MPAVPKRDKLAFELAEKASKQHRDKKENALRLASRLARYFKVNFKGSFC